MAFFWLLIGGGNMKDRTIAICSKIEELISFLKIEKGKRTAQRLLNRAETLAYTSLPFALNTDYNRVCQEMLPLCNDLMCEKLKVLILRIEMYKKDYVGHATKAKQFVRDFDKIEPTLKQCKETLRFGSNKCDDNNGIRHDKLANVISAAENCVSNLSEQYDLWKQEVKEEKKTDWKSKLWVQSHAV